MRLLAEVSLDWNSVASEFVDQVLSMPADLRSDFKGVFIKSVRELGSRFGVEIPAFVLREVEKT